MLGKLENNLFKIPVSCMDSSFLFNVIEPCENNLLLANLQTVVLGFIIIIMIYIYCFKTLYV